MFILFIYIFSKNKIRPTVNGKPYSFISYVPTYHTAHRTIARCNDDDGGDAELYFSFVIIFYEQSYYKKVKCGKI